jgi:hypothetical protein
MRSSGWDLRPAMASKKYIGKTCAYCTKEGVSETPDHVVAREFFLVKDRGNLPIVTACSKCNGEKSALEHYALSILPLGSRHADVRSYSEQNIERRLRKNPRLRSQLRFQHSGHWEVQKGLFLPVMSLAIDEEKIRGLFSLIVRGLFMFHWGEALDLRWQPDVAIITNEGAVFPKIFALLGPRFESVGRNLGRGTLVYEGHRSLAHKWNSVWQFAWYGGMQFASDADVMRRPFTRISALTVREDAKAMARKMAAAE